MEQINDLLNYNVADLPLYKIILGMFIFFISIFARKLFSLIVLKTARQFVESTKTDIDDKILDILEQPLRFSFIIMGAYLSTTLLDLYNALISNIVSSMVIFVVFWILYDFVKIFQDAIFKFSSQFGKELSEEIGHFLIKALKVFIIAIGIVAIMQKWGINVSAFLASLGIGGLAFALAAKDTVANLFGGLVILTDKVFKIGDWIKVSDVEGIVEEIGMRTTKVRAFDKALITLPNANIANSSVNNFSRRNRRRIKMRIGVTYSTKPEQMQQMLEEIRQMLLDHKMVHNNPMFVYFDEFGSSDLSIFFYLFTTTAVWEDYLKIREDVNLKIMQIVEKHGAEFAFPSQSLYFENMDTTLFPKEKLPLV